MNRALQYCAGWLFRNSYPIYLPLYTAFKALADRTERAQLRRLIEPGMQVVDIGANIGIYTRYLAGLVHDSGHVYAFEPDPHNFARLRTNIARLDNVTVIQGAIGAVDGHTKLYLSGDLNVDHHTYDDGTAKRASIDVRLLRLDDCFPPGKRIDFIKIDVQGYEMQVLLGAERVLRENPEIVLLLEYWPYGLTRAKCDPDALLALVRSHGFGITQVIQPFGQNTGLDQFDPGREADYCNLLLSRTRKPVENCDQR